MVLALLILLALARGARVVPQSGRSVVERFGRLRSVPSPGLSIVVPFPDRVAHRISILERQLPTSKQDAIASASVLTSADASVSYRIRDADAAITTTVAGILRSEIGRMELDGVRSNRSSLIGAVGMRLADQVDAMVALGQGAGASGRWRCARRPSMPSGTRA